jgi:hypothetical protein
MQLGKKFEEIIEVREEYFEESEPVKEPTSTQSVTAFLDSAYTSAQITNRPSLLNPDGSTAELASNVRGVTKWDRRPSQRIEAEVKEVEEEVAQSEEEEDIVMRKPLRVKSKVC